MSIEAVWIPGHFAIAFAFATDATNIVVTDPNRSISGCICEPRVLQSCRNWRGTIWIQRKKKEALQNLTCHIFLLTTPFAHDFTANHNDDLAHDDDDGAVEGGIGVFVEFYIFHLPPRKNGLFMEDGYFPHLAGSEGKNGWKRILLGSRGLLSPPRPHPASRSA